MFGHRTFGRTIGGLLGFFPTGNWAQNGECDILAQYNTGDP